MAQTTLEGTPGTSGTKLKRTVGTLLLFFFIVGDTLGAGIYTLVGDLSENVGGALWVPLILALVLALLTAGTYAELITKYPHAGGAARYAERAFKLPYVTFIVGFLMLSSGITTAASLANAFAGEYLSEIVRLPAVPVTLGFIAVLILINLRGVKESLSANVVMTVIEVSGLMLVITVAAIAIGAGRGDPGRVLEFAAEVPPLEGVFAATIIAFFSFLGFEAAANMAEEVTNPTRSYPRALFGAIITAGVVYLLIALGASMVVTPEQLTSGETRPLLNVVEGSGVGVPSLLFSIVALVAIANGALLFTVMASRATYGLAEAGLLPRSFGRVLRTRRTPWVAILAVGLLTMGMSFVGDVSVLASTTVLLLVLVFISANISVLVLKKDKVEHPHVTVPRVVSVVALVVSIALLTQQEPIVWAIGGGYVVLGTIVFLLARVRTRREAAEPTTP
ncbi:APC family permease [Pseudactinotalea suaedae]|uniref:APC family permease n=1 Tax=Pseudactinotalea suaedae TaxID=1524924 RepID=UPI0012E221AF|nr:APC family permease [Pseudactinotalea suaedae]